MYFQSGSINIKNILITSFIIQLLLSYFIFFKFFEKGNRVYNYKCISDRDYYLNNTSELEIFNDFEDFKKICEDIQLNKDNKNIKFYSLSFDLDSGSYFVNLAQLNQLFYVTKNLDKKFEEGDIKYKNNTKKILILKKFISDTKIKHLEKIQIYSSIYVNFFDNNNYVYEFILFLNFIILSIITTLLFKISKIIFPSISSYILCLCIFNLIINPIFWIYFLSFYKEPLILLSFTIIIYNFVNIFLSKINFKLFTTSTILVLISLVLVNYIKPEYNLILLTSYTIGICFILLKKFYLLKIFFIQFAIITLLFFGISKNYTTYFFNFIKLNTLNNLNLVDANIEEKKFDIKNKNKNDNDQKRLFGKNSIIEGNYYFPNKNIEKVKEFDDLNCFTYLGDFICEKLNSFSYRIHAIKNATLWENNFFSENASFNKNIINTYQLNSTSEVILKAPISVLKFFYMPFLLNENKFIIIISFFKVTISVLYIICMMIFYIRKKYNYLYIFLGIFFIFLPLGIATDLITSNFFTYYRYIYPINIFVIFLLYLFFVYIFTSKND